MLKKSKVLALHIR